LPARHGRSDQRGQACAQDPKTRGDLDASWTVCERSTGRQSKSGGPDLLFGIDFYLHSGFTGANWCDVSGGTGRGSTHAWCSDARRFPQLSARDRNAFQSGLRSTAVELPIRLHTEGLATVVYYIAASCRLCCSIANPRSVELEYLSKAGARLPANTGHFDLGPLFENFNSLPN